MLEAYLGWAVFAGLLLLLSSATALPCLYAYGRVVGSDGGSWRTKLFAVAVGCGVLWFGVPWVVGILYG